MPSWTLIETDPTQGRVFRRPLQGVELGFFWDGHLNGTADNLHHVELRLVNVSRDAHLFSEDNITKAWLSTKRRYPLSGATVQILPDSAGGDPAPFFVVREHDLAVLRPREIIFGEVTCAEEVQKRIAALWGGPRPLSDELLAQLYVFRETGSQRSADVLHFVNLIAHCVTDGMANRTFMRCLVDTLARSGGPGSELAQAPLEDRLAMVVPSEDLEPMHLRSLSLARQRWRRAISAVIFQSWMASLQGGHTLPCRLTRATPLTPSQTSLVSVSPLTEEQTSAVIANCRSHGITFGSAYLALAQVAMTRVLYRRYLRGEISKEEWAYRKRQPYQIMGPVNLRPHLDKAWYERGGGGDFMCSVNILIYSLPFMTLGETERCQYRERDLPEGAPPFPDLLSFDRFLHRAGLVKKQTKSFLGHPLFSEIQRVSGSFFAHTARLLAQEWEATHAGIPNGTGNAHSDEVLAVTDIPMVFAHGGSSLGNVRVSVRRPHDHAEVVAQVHLIFPMAYPLPSTHPLSPLSAVPHPARAGYVSPPTTVEGDVAPRVVVESATTRLHARPGELYLGALSSRGRLSMYVSYDGNVYEEGVVREWLDEVRGAVLWYLCQTHRSRRDQVDAGQA